MNILEQEELKQMVLVVGVLVMGDLLMAAVVAVDEHRELVGELAVAIKAVEQAIKVLFVYGIIGLSTSPSMRTCRSGM